MVSVQSSPPSHPGALFHSVVGIGSVCLLARFVAKWNIQFGCISRNTHLSVLYPIGRVGVDIFEVGWLPILSQNGPAATTHLCHTETLFLSRHESWCLFKVAHLPTLELYFIAWSELVQSAFWPDLWPSGTSNLDALAATSTSLLARL